MCLTADKPAKPLGSRIYKNTKLVIANLNISTERKDANYECCNRRRE